MSMIDSCLLLSCTPSALSLTYSFLDKKESRRLACCHTFLHRLSNSPLTLALRHRSPILGRLIRTITPKQGLDKRSHIVMSNVGHIYISEGFRHRITVFDGNNSKFLRYIGIDKLVHPGGITIDECKQILYVIDRDGVSVRSSYCARMIIYHIHLWALCVCACVFSVC